MKLLLRELEWCGAGLHHPIEDFNLFAEASPVVLQGFFFLKDGLTEAFRVFEGAYLGHRQTF